MHWPRKSWISIPLEEPQLFSFTIMCFGHLIVSASHWLQDPVRGLKGGVQSVYMYMYGERPRQYQQLSILYPNPGTHVHVKVLQKSMPSFVVKEALIISILCPMNSSITRRRTRSPASMPPHEH